ncbi:MAG: aminotransferase class V-fold PLP-dependent enzyme [Synechococcaceae cyanobacterium SM2_3_1]|nr:aminotransferase class V-fold PLP-dependent enzyme [Synechococcaceae cyanobacterium SM2_3_1]
MIYAALLVIDLEQLNRYRRQFPALADKTYLNFGGHGPLSQTTLAAIQNAYAFEQRQGPFSATVNTWIQENLLQLRTHLAQMLHTTWDRICLTENTTAGMNIPLWGLDWQPGDQILLSDAEHPGVIAILQVLAKRMGVEPVTLPLMNNPDPVTTLEEAITPRSRMLLISHVFWNTGRIQPLKALTEVCHTHDLLIHVDAAQSAGVLPLDLPALGVDFYAFTGHKWLCGPAGTGVLYMSERGQSRLLPTFVGWRALGHEDAAAFEVATSAWALLVGLRAALQDHEQLGSIEERYQRQVSLALSLWSQIQDLPGLQCLRSDPPDTGLVSFTLDHYTPAQLESTLAQEQILIRSLPHPPSVRASIHYLSCETEVETLVQSLARLSKR